MSTTVKRVSLDFDWPLKEVWRGYTNPYAPEVKKCQACEHSGYGPFAHSIYEAWYGYRAFKPEDNGSTPFLPTDKAVLDHVIPKVEREFEFYNEEARKSRAGVVDFFSMMSQRTSLEEFEAKWGVQVDQEAFGKLTDTVQVEAVRMCNLFNSQMSHHLNQDDVDALVADGRLMELTHDFVRGQGWVKKVPEVVPSADEVNRWSLTGMGHDSINLHVVVKASCKRNNEVMTCPECEGHGRRFHFSSDDQEARYERWEPYEPPAGKGFQYWETISEGSPVSPVFEDPADLAEWLYNHRNHNQLTREEWVNLIAEGGACISMMSVNGQMMSGEKAIAQQEEAKSE